MMQYRIVLLSVLTLLVTGVHAQKQYTLQSPDKGITITVNVDRQLSYSVKEGNTSVLATSPIAMKLADGTTLGDNPKVKRVKTASVNETIKANFYKRDEISDVYNEMTMTFKGNYKVIFRAYNEGVAYRFQTEFPKDITIAEETADFNFDSDKTVTIPYVNARKGFCVKKIPDKFAFVVRYDQGFQLHACYDFRFSK